MGRKISDELKKAWKDAYSVRPGEDPDGDYIGDIKKGNIVFHFYKTKGGEYRYISERIK